ncbi:MAG: tRNA threonylcarbamoyladenosine biosynthesis protein TsaE [Bacteroidetes bacterium ADurb.Bin408]|nr:MAG: tRNA threonylcarbamoyladenosine biosynthesis protein TsaE [Bacteroidetes bacterium ADurb.Bin408]
MELIIKSIKDINKVARQFIKLIDDRRVFLFSGKMGVGKTTFIKAICEELGVKEIVNSPTFSIVNEYEAADGRIIYHFDCYRITKIQEALDLGVEEYLYSGNFCFLEWAENITPLLPYDAVNVDIEELENGERTIKVG